MDSRCLHEENSVIMKLPKSALTISLIMLLCSALPCWGFADKGVEVENSEEMHGNKIFAEKSNC